MTKAELTERIVDAMIDPWTDCAEDYIDSEPIDINEAVKLLKQIRQDERSWGAEPDERLPKEVTPELVRETYNCLIRARKRDARINQLTEYLADNPDALVYAYNNLVHDHPLAGPNDIVPMDFFYDSLAEGCFYFDTNDKEFSKAEIMKLMYNSENSFDHNDTYICLYITPVGDAKLVTTSEPSDAIDVEEFAEYIFDHKDVLAWFLHDYEDENGFVEDIFNCNKEELLK